MRNERLKAEGSKMSVEKVEPFTDPNWYLMDASDFIVRRAILSGDMDVLNKLEKKGKIFYWLPEENGWDVAHQFFGIDKDGKRMFYRFRSRDKVELEEEDIRKLEMQKILSHEEIKQWGFIYGVPTLEEVKSKFQM